MKRIFAGMAAVLMAAIFLFPVKVCGLSAEHAILLDAQTERVLYERRADEQALIASTTKIMTALVVCEQTNVLDRVRIPREAVGIEGSSLYLKAGEVLTVQELLYGLMLHSGNDAAVALAIYCGGTVEGFVQRMNDKAHAMGLRNTHFENPHGLDSPHHYSTARDLARLAAYAMENPIFARTVSAKTVTAGGRHLRNHNKLLWQVEGTDGVKTGYTRAAGRILVSSAQRHGRRLVAVTINAPSDWQDHKQLLEEGFRQYEIRTIVLQGQRLGMVEVESGQQMAVELLAADSFSYALAAGEEPAILLPKQEFVYAPVVCGQDAGTALICLGEETIGHIALKFGQTIEIEQEAEKPFWKKWFGGS